VFFVDANVFFNKAHHKTWDALVQRRVAVTPLVFQELQHSWIANPSANTHIHQLVVDWVRDRESPVFELFQPDPKNEVISKAVPYYMALLIARKMLWGFVSDQFLEERGSQPTDAEVERTIRRWFV